jgi:Gpi18-like mannosyltransferase
MKKLPPLFEDRLPTAVDAAALPVSGSRARGVLLVLLIFAGTRLLTWTATYYGATMLLCIRHQIEPPFSMHQKSLQEDMEEHGPVYQSFMDLLTNLAPLCHFDGYHYTSIIEGGYKYTPPPPGATDRSQLEQNIAFFPLFPVLCRSLTGWLTTAQAMILVVHVCSLAASLILYFWLRERLGEPTALLAAAITLCWPSAVYYSYGYAESVTLLAFVTALWLIDTRHFAAAAVASGIATATRPTALAIAVVLVLAYWMNSPEPRRRRIWKMIPLGLVGAGGILAYAGYLTYRFHSPLIYFDNFKAGWVPDKQRADWLEFLTLTPIWDQFHYFRDVVLTPPPIGLVNLAHPFLWNVPLLLFILFLSLAGLSRVPRSFRPLLALGPLIFLHSYLASGGAKFGIEPIGRYMAVSVPAFIVLAVWCMREWRPVGRHLLLTFMILLQAAWAFRFGLQEWSG